MGTDRTRASCKSFGALRVEETGVVDCIFCRIAAGHGETPLLYDDGEILAFPDLHPQAPFHALLIPRAHIANTLALRPEHDPLIGRIIRVAAGLTTERGIAHDGYRLVTNTNAMAGQSVYHLHFHLLGGRALTWPPG